MHPNSLANLKPDPQAAAKEGDRASILITLPNESVAFLDEMVAEAKRIRKISGSGHPKKIGRGDVIEGLLLYLQTAQANPDATNPEEARLMALGLLE
jgi:hypothetical protein